MNIPFRSFTDVVRDMSSAFTASTGKLVDISVGSILRGIIEANAAVVLWVQWLILLMLKTTRAATSSDEDLDSWMADFSLIRHPASSATGTVTLSRLSNGLRARVSAGAVLKTQDGTVGFVVVEDSFNSAWDPVQTAYALETGIRSLTVPIRAALPGQGGNVLPNTITLIASTLPGIDIVNNDIETKSGEAAESDVEFRTRFQNFFASRSKATAEAIGYAVSQVQRDLKYIIYENTDAAGRPKIGTVLVMVDDGSGSLSATLNTSLAIAIEAVRPIGTIIVLQSPRIFWVDVVVSLQVNQNILESVLHSNVVSSIQIYINALPIAGKLSLSRLIQMIYQNQADIENISELTLNGQYADLQAASGNSLKLRNASFK